MLLPPPQLLRPVHVVRQRKSCPNPSTFSRVDGSVVIGARVAHGDPLEPSRVDSALQLHGLDVDVSEEVAVVYWRFLA